MIRASTVVMLMLCSSLLAQQTQRVYLSGKGSDDAVPWEFFCTEGLNSGKWTTIPVPSCWDMENFGRLTYGRQQPRATEQGQYRHRFNVPGDWTGQRVWIVFEGVMTDAQVKVNGQSAGPMHQGGFYRFKYEITPLVKLGQENLLEVTVDKDSANVSINRAERSGDYWNFGGIYRPVYLEVKPPQCIERVAIDARADGQLAIEAFMSGITSADAVQAQVFDMQGNAVGAPFAQKIGDERVKVSLQARIDSPRQWTAETPTLYQVEVRLMQGGVPVHQVTQRFGFRTIEVRKGDGIYVNGKKITLKGTNRHSFWPDSGRCTSEKISRLDAALMKEMNNNAVRMSHYPPDEHFLDVCDEVGPYVLDELAGWQAFYDEPTGRRLIRQIIERDVNHPSILFWDNGNEGGWNAAVDDEFAKWDPQQRAVLHPWAKFGDINTAHYPSFDRVTQLCNGPDVYFPTEFLHGLFDGGMGAGLEDYWRVMRASKVCAGGFLWAYCDESIRRKDRNGEMDGAGNQAPDGIVGPYREKEGSFYTVKEIWSPVVVTRERDKFTVENRYDFTNTNQCRFTWQLRKFRSPDDELPEFTIVAEGTAKSPSIAPGASGVLPFELPWDRPADALSVRVDDPSGRELWTWVWPAEAGGFPPEVTSVPRVAPEVTEDAELLNVTHGALTIRFDKRTGYLSSVTHAGKSSALTNGPRLAVGQANLESLQHRVDGRDYLVELVYSGDLKSVKWRILPGGCVQMSYDYRVEGPHNFAGVCFDLPESKVKSMKWLGNGPFRVWKNRMSGGTLNVWQTSFNDTMTGYSEWVYPEFKGYYSDVRWMKLETSDGPISISSAQDSYFGESGLFVQVLRPRFPGDPKPAATTRATDQLSGNAWTTFPDAGLSFLHAIPPIGSKFRTAASTGPQGQLNQATADYHGTIRLDFGR